MDRADERPRGGLTAPRAPSGTAPSDLPERPAGGDDPGTRPLRAAGEAGVFGPYLRRCNFPPPPAAVTCAVSGGPDSLALLVLARAAGLEVTAVYVDHGIRPASAADAGVVAAAAAALGAGFRCETVSVPPGPNLEARARCARYAALPDGALLGHTADDQAETVLLNLLRGAGLAGVAAMESGERRPLLGLRRAEAAEVCRLAGLAPVLDESNLDPAIRRNRVRHDLIPLLEQIFERDVAPLLCRHAGLAREATEALDAAVADLDPRDCAALAAAPRALARWALRRWITEGRWITEARGTTTAGERHPPDLAAVDRVLAVALGEARATDVGGGWRVRRSAQRLHLEPTAGNPRVCQTDPP